PITITSGELRSLRTRLSSYSNCLNIAYSGIFSYKHSVLRICIHYKTFIATMTSADFSWLTFFDQALRSLILKFTRLNLSIRSLGVRHSSLVFHNLLVYRLGFTFVLWSSTSYAVLSTILSYHVSF